MRVLFVHGIGQESRSEKELTEEWLNALKSGFSAAGISAPAFDCSLPFYGDKLVKLAAQYQPRSLADFDRYMTEANAQLGEPNIQPPSKNLGPYPTIEGAQQQRGSEVGLKILQNPAIRAAIASIDQGHPNLSTWAIKQGFLAVV